MVDVFTCRIPTSLYGKSEHVEQVVVRVDCDCSACEAARRSAGYVRPALRPLVITEEDLGVYGRLGGRYDGDFSNGERTRDGVRWVGYVRVSESYGDRYARAEGNAPGPAPAVVWGEGSDGFVTSRLAARRAAVDAPGGQSCEHCGADFEARRSDARFCSGTCRKAAQRLRR